MAELTVELLLRAYALGIFPMAENADSRELYWFDPDRRGILPLDRFHLSRRLRRTVRSGLFQIGIDTAFAEVIRSCAAVTTRRPNTWINREITRLYCQLHDYGFAHSVETWRNGVLVGGLYGVALGGVFFGESMFSRETDASKVALVHLVARLNRGGFTLLDTQFVTEHLSQFGSIEIPRDDYRDRLGRALLVRAEFDVDQDAALADLLAGPVAG